MTGRVAHHAIVLSAMLMAGCTGDAGRSTPPPGPEAMAGHAGGQVQAIVLPDLSMLAPSVQLQVRERDAQLTQIVGTKDASPVERAVGYAALGRVLMAAQFSDAAASCFLNAETLVPDDGRWPYYLGQAYLRTHDRPHAAEAFERAVRIRPNDLAAIVWLGETYFDDGKLDLARSTFGRALALAPQSAAALFGAGRTALAQQAYAEAAGYMERALAADGGASAIHYPLAMAYRALGDGQKAEAHLRKRGSAFPNLPDPLMQEDAEVLDSPSAYETRGMDALTRADFASAEDSFRKGLALVPTDASLRYWLGATLYAAGDAPGAEREFLAVIRESPDYARAYFSLGAIDDARGRRPEAIEQYRAAVKADPGLPEARLRLGDDLRATAQLEAAFVQYEAAVKLDPGIAEAWIGGARALIGLDRQSEAADWLAQGRRVHPSRPELAELESQLARAAR